MQQLCSHLFKHICNNYFKINSYIRNCLIKSVHDFKAFAYYQDGFYSMIKDTRECPFPCTPGTVAIIINFSFFFANFIGGN